MNLISRWHCSQKFPRTLDPAFVHKNIISPTLITTLSSVDLLALPQVKYTIQFDNVKLEKCPNLVSGEPDAGAGPAAVFGLDGAGAALWERAGEDAAPDGPPGHGRPRVDAPRPMDGPHGGREHYRVTSKVEAYISMTSIWGVPSACGPLLQLAHAQAGQENFPN